MGERLFSRRRFIAATGASLTAAGLYTSTATASEWDRVKREILGEEELRGVDISPFLPRSRRAVSGRRLDPSQQEEQQPTAVAVGEGGIVLARDEGGSWKTVLDTGPSGENNDLNALDSIKTAGTAPSQGYYYGLQLPTFTIGENATIGEIEFEISSGASRNYEVTETKVIDHSKPNGVTHDFTGVAVTRSPRGANVYIASKSGEIVYSFAGGESRTWNSTKISEAPMKAVDFHGPRSGHAIDRTQTVYATTDGTTWTPIGIPSASNTFYGVESRAPNDVTVAADGGFIWRWNGYRWTPKHTGDDALRDVDRGYSGPNGLACGADGTIQRYDGAWKAEQTPTDETLLGVARATDYQSNNLDIAVGKQGTILKKKSPPKPPRFFNGSVS